MTQTTSSSSHDVGQALPTAWTLLQSYWVMVVMDVFTRRLIGFGIERGNPDGVDGDLNPLDFGG